MKRPRRVLSLRRGREWDHDLRWNDGMFVRNHSWWAGNAYALILPNRTRLFL